MVCVWNPGACLPLSYKNLCLPFPLHFLASHLVLPNTFKLKISFSFLKELYLIPYSLSHSKAVDWRTQLNAENLYFRESWETLPHPNSSQFTTLCCEIRIMPSFCKVHFLHKMYNSGSTELSQKKYWIIES